MNIKTFAGTVILFLGLAWAIRPVQAQGACSNLTLRVESTLVVDEAAVCQAAQPWADEGVRVFVYLTDAQPVDEAAWFALLDQVETESGFRLLNDFDRDVLALEATTGTSAAWGTTVTYGELLYDTPVDNNEAAISRIKSEMRQAIQNENPTTAFVSGLEEAYALNNPPPSPILMGAGVVAGLGVIGAGGFVAYKQVVVPAQNRARRRRELQEQLARLRQSVANLLLALEGLIAGSKPADAMLYQVFDAYGGKHEPERDAAVRGWLAQSQEAFYAAFDLRRELDTDEEISAEALPEAVRRWEMIYLTLVGSSARIRNLTESQLRDLLDPVVVLERDPAESPLVAQLRDISRQIQGMPLKVEMMLVDPDEVDQEGILGYLDQVEEQIGELMAAQASAPGILDEAGKARLRAEEEAAAASPFGMAPAQLLPEIAARLTKAQHNLEQGAFVGALAEAETILRDVEIVEDVLDAAAEHDARETEIAAILKEGFRPRYLEESRQEIAADIAEIKTHFQAGDYLTADNWIDELDSDSAEALRSTIAWRDLHLFNEESLARVQERLTAVQAFLVTEATPAWAALQAYPAANWQEVIADLATVQQTLAEMDQEGLPAIRDLNSLGTQEFADAELQLASLGAELRDSERQLQALVARLAEVETAETSIAESLRVTQADLDRAINLRNLEDTKVGADVDRQLEAAAAQLEAARDQATRREFIGAVAAQLAARQQAVAAHAAASEQVAQINELQENLAAVQEDAEVEARHLERASGRLLPQMRTSQTEERVSKAQTEIATARQERAGLGGLEDVALAAALATAVTAYTAAMSQAKAAQSAIDDDRRSYDKMVDEARSAIDQARRAISRAEDKCGSRDAGSACRHALRRARNGVPNKSDTDDATRAQLKELKRRAEQAESDAKGARQQAEEDIRRARRRRQAAWTVSSGGSGWSSSGSGRRSSRRSSGRSSHRSSSRSSSSRRSSSRSSSSRSRSSGSSRRSSSRGSSRRR